MGQLTLPLPPSSNNAYKNAGKKGRVLTPEGRAYKDKAAMIARGLWRGAVLEGDVAIIGTVYLDSARRDLSNCIKLMEDSLKGICYGDDRQVAHIDLRRRYDRGNPRVEMDVVVYEEAA
jgi:Holliday junction resolvase RusA-like endonuclease